MTLEGEVNEHVETMIAPARASFHETADRDMGARVFAWGARAIYLGPALDLSAHRNAVAVLAIGLDAPFGVASPPADAPPHYRQCTSVLVPPNTLHHFAATRGRMAFVYVDPFSQDVTRLLESAAERQPHAAFDLQGEDRLAEILSALASGAIDWPSSRIALDAFLSGSARTAIDPRVKMALSILHRSADERISLEELASRVCLSESRLRHLFKATTGVPLRRYRIWVAMRVALQAIALGDSLTVAAMDAGFSSSAHFSAAFRKMFGMEPSRFAKGRLGLG